MSRLERDRAAAMAASKASQAQAKRENTKHTPGPWRATERTITAPETEDRLGMECRLYGGNRRDNRANARLIAAAPDLVFQLLSAANYIDALGGDSKSYRAAIARATGEPQ